MPNRRMLIRCLRYAPSLGRPGPDLSWITDLVGISGTLQPRHIPELAEMGVRSIIDLREEDRDDPELLAQHDIRFLHLPTRDRSSPCQKQLVEGARWVLDEVQAHRRTVVHCKEGIGRSVAVVCCALILGGDSLAGAVRLVRARRWGVALNARQMLGLKEFAQRAEFAQQVMIKQRPFQPATDHSVPQEG
jgi:protein-tyrosine phosphatase